MHRNDYYRPSDDTFLLAECLQNVKGRSAMEIGTGSGYICGLLKKQFEMVVATDIDLNAIRHAEKSVVDATFVCCDSCSAISNVKFDLIVINPPYLPSEEIRDMAVDGGKNGIEVSMRMIQDSVRLLHSNGRILMVTSSLANYQLMIEELHELGLETSVIGRKKFDFEDILVLQASFSQHVFQPQSPSGD